MQAPNEAQIELHRRLVWLTFFRLAVVTVLFAATLFWGSSEDIPSSLQMKLLGLCGSGFVATLAFAALLRFQRWLSAIAYAEISFDVLLATGLVFFTGGSSAFSFVFILAIVNAALVFSQRGAVLSASLSSALFALLRWALNERWLEPPAPFLARSPTTLGPLLFSIFINLAAFFLVAALTSYLADQLQNKSEQLSARELDYTALSELHRAILASIPSGIATAEQSGRLIFVNRAGWEICRSWQDERTGLLLQELLPGLVLPASDRPAIRQELTIPGRSGELRHLGLTVSALRLAGANADGHVVVFQDLTDLRRLEVDARRNERLAAVGKLAAGLAHELRNPLASMSGAVQMLVDGKTGDPDERRLAEIVVGETDRLNRLVTDFLGFARPSPARPTWLDLGALTAQTLDIVAHGPLFENVTVHRDLLPLELSADGAQLRQVIWNLMVNAAEALGGKGNIWVRVGVHGGEAVLEIQDDGPGIAPDDMAHLFDPFFTTKPSGTGLGLATVHALVEAHRGRVAVNAREAGGAVFSVWLPMAAQPNSFFTSQPRAGEESVDGSNSRR